jgi:hypothetical protein
MNSSEEGKGDGSMAEKLIEYDVKKFADVMASDAPAPGGGSASALAEALGASLVSMVCALTKGREKYQAFEAQAVKAEADRAYLIETDSSGLSVDGNQVILATAGQFTALGRLALFASHYGNTSYDNNFTGRFYHFRAWDAQSNLALDLLPCSVNGEVCFYDRVSKTYLHPSAAISPDGAAVADNGYAVTASTGVLPLTAEGFLVIVK